MEIKRNVNGDIFYQHSATSVSDESQGCCCAPETGNKNSIRILDAFVGLREFKSAPAISGTPGVLMAIIKTRRPFGLSGILIRVKLRAMEEEEDGAET